MRLNRVARGPRGAGDRLRVAYLRSLVTRLGLDADDPSVRLWLRQCGYLWSELNRLTTEAEAYRVQLASPVSKSTRARAHSALRALARYTRDARSNLGSTEAKLATLVVPKKPLTDAERHARDMAAIEAMPPVE